MKHGDTDVWAESARELFPIVGAEGWPSLADIIEDTKDPAIDFIIIGNNVDTERRPDVE